MKRMWSENELIHNSNKTITLKETNPDIFVEPGNYKVSNILINGKSYDGTLVVLPWDTHYLRQVFYTIDNGDPNPIFTRVKVNKTKPWKEWKQMTVGGLELPNENNLIKKVEVAVQTGVSFSTGKITNGYYCIRFYDISDNCNLNDIYIRFDTSMETITQPLLNYGDDSIFYIDFVPDEKGGFNGTITDIYGTSSGIMHTFSFYKVG